MKYGKNRQKRFITLVLTRLTELGEDLGSMKQTHSGVKDALIEIQNNLQRNSRRVGEAENQVNDLEHKEAKTSNQHKKKKKESKK